MYIGKRTTMKYNEVTSDSEARDKSWHRRKPRIVKIILEHPKVKNIPSLNIG